MGKIITIPFAALLRWIYAFTQSYGLSIILFALVIKVIMLPFQMKSKRSMIRMGRLSKKQEELKKQYAKNQQKYNEELQKLYQEEGINPAGGCLWSLLPLFLIIPLYRIIYNPLSHFMGLSEESLAQLKTAAEAIGFANGGNAAYEQVFLSEFVTRHWENFEGTIDGLINVNYRFLGMDLSSTPTAMVQNFSFTWGCIAVVCIPLLAATSQFISSKLIAKSNNQSPEQMKQMRTMNVMMLGMSLWFTFMMPAAMGVYWVVNTVLSTVQEMILGKFYTKKIEEEEAVRAAEREADRKKRQEEARARAAENALLESKKAKKAQPQKAVGKAPTTEEGRVGDRPYARGRNYKADRYDD